MVKSCQTWFRVVSLYQQNNQTQKNQKHKMTKFQSLLEHTVQYLHACNCGNEEIFQDAFIEEVERSKSFSELHDIFDNDDVLDDLNDCLIAYFREDDKLREEPEEGADHVRMTENDNK